MLIRAVLTPHLRLRLRLAPLLSQARARCTRPWSSAPVPSSSTWASANQSMSTTSNAAAPLRLAIVNCPGADVYHKCFVRWIGEHYDSPVEFKVYEAEQEDLPNVEGAGAQYDGFIITGSRYGVYEDVQWIRGLVDWIAAAHQQRQKILGVCFGHQAVAKALGGSVIVNPAGFKIGRYTTGMSDEAVEYFKSLGTWDEARFADRHLTMNFAHGDFIPEDGKPPGLASMGGTEFSPHNGLFNRDNILTFQGHPEFVTANVHQCEVKLVERGVLPKRLPVGVDFDQVHATLGGPVDSDWICRTAMRFFRA